MHSMLFLPTIYLLAAVIAVPLASRLGLGSVLGYLSAGVLIGLMPRPWRRDPRFAAFCRIRRGDDVVYHRA